LRKNPSLPNRKKEKQKEEAEAEKQRREMMIPSKKRKDDCGKELNILERKKLEKVDQLREKRRRIEEDPSIVQPKKKRHKKIKSQKN